ncbi:hypothetical protein [Microbulbifer sp. HZ11]|uniref:hypothetical protein n=1 Tax=Microbulbifer sp. HZ11 TaxID=1453501 RepID=UPI0005BE0160|nr:hypothetical protein [Microbulbifer sp. HZ11]
MPTKHAVPAILTASLALTGCSGIQFNSSLEPYVEDRIKTKMVREYSIAEIDQYNATTLGFVDASYCQERMDERKASKSQLVSDLKLRTKNLGGNGLVVEACGTGAIPGCYSFMECRGVAYSVPERKGDSIPPTTASNAF